MILSHTVLIPIECIFHGLCKKILKKIQFFVQLRGSFCEEHSIKNEKKKNISILEFFFNWWRSEFSALARNIIFSLEARNHQVFLSPKLRNPCKVQSVLAIFNLHFVDFYVNPNCKGNYSLFHTNLTRDYSQGKYLLTFPLFIMQISYL